MTCILYGLEMLIGIYSFFEYKDSVSTHGEL